LRLNARTSQSLGIHLDLRTPNVIALATFCSRVE
jgi:hypothetical protein